jgi:hypothetical protein
MPQLQGRNGGTDGVSGEDELRTTRKSKFIESYDQGVKRFGRWLLKKGWVKDTDLDAASVHASEASRSSKTREMAQLAEQKGAMLVLEFAAAYAITKVLLPMRIAVSVWATPWFARTVLGPVRDRATSILRK